MPLVVDLLFPGLLCTLPRRLRHNLLFTILIVLACLPMVASAPPLMVMTLNVNNMGQNWQKNEECWP
jgi:hypothetical protein